MRIVARSGLPIDTSIGPRNPPGAILRAPISELKRMYGRPLGASPMPEVKSTEGGVKRSNTAATGPSSRYSPSLTTMA